MTDQRQAVSGRHGERRERSALVLAGAAGLLAGVLVMNLASPPRVEVVNADGRVTSGDAADLDALGEDGSFASGDIGADGAAGGDGAAAGRSGSSSGRTSGGGGASGASAGSGSSGSGGGPLPRGVTDSTVRIGFTFFNVGTYGVVPAYDVGPGPEKMNAVLERWRREGRDTLHGRKIELVYTEFSITDEASQRAACLDLVEEKKVFAVAAPAGLYAGTDCVTKEKQTPLVQTASTGGTAEGVRDRAPYFFMVAPDRSQISRNWARWAHTRGLLEGKTIGFYYSQEEEADLHANFIAELEKLGYGDNIAVKVTATDDDEVGPEDTIAVNQFRGEGVNLAILLLNGLRMENFMNQAQGQGYQPDYIASDLGVNTDDTKTTTFAPTQWDGTFAMTTMMYGMQGIALPPEAQVCMEDYRRQGRNPEAGKADFNYALMSCHALELVWQALNNAGRDLTVGSYIRGMEQIKGYAGAFNPSTTFSATDHTGSDFHRTLQWRASCRCYQPVTDWARFFLP